ncbi:MAG TPA: NERD domain-containing protein, partial [Anaerolineales bacterium]|nr:NERD domain-containing protein [Anaerolineales bacterium]
MKIIDKTPLVDQKGDLGFTQRIQGMLRYGFGWPAELQAQKAIISFFDKNLEKGYTLLRNVPLGQSGILIPFILLGPAGIFAINLTFQRGRFEARGDSWNVESGTQYRRASVNLLQVTSRMARALQTFIERQGTKLPVPVEPILIAGDPGVHIESTRPAIRVMMIDGIKSFVSGLATSAPVITALAVNEAVDRILEPRQLRQEPISSPMKPAAREPEREPEPEPVSRARAIFNASEEPKPFNPSEF